MVDTRSVGRSLLNRERFSSWDAAIRIAACVLLAVLIALLPRYEGLDDGGRWALFILILAAGLWITEAIPAFAVGLLVIGLEIAILGRPGGVFARDADDWERFIVVWGSPLIWLFFGGFVLAAAAEKTRLTTWLAQNVLRVLGHRPAIQLLGCMGMTAVFSMFISNTATATMMVAVLLPLARSLADDDPFRKALLLGVAFAANLGGMATVIGSPPNAISAGALRHVEPIDFVGWILAGLPPALILLAIAWGYLILRFPAHAARLDTTRLQIADSSAPQAPLWQRVSVIVVFAATVGLWLTTGLHKIPATVIAFLPTCAFTALGILDAADVRSVRWDVLLLIAGGLALGVAVSDTGLAAWLVSRLPLAGISAFALALALCYTTSLLSNLMSNTAAANILVPIAIAASAGFESETVVPIALGASAAMCLPISTPPNAIAYGTGELATRDLLYGGLLIGLVTPPIVTAWCWLVL